MNSTCDLIEKAESCGKTGLKHWRQCRFGSEAKKAMTVFYIGSLLWFKPFNGFFHLKALVGVCLACVWCHFWAGELLPSGGLYLSLRISSHHDDCLVFCALIGCSWNILFYLIVCSPATQTPVSQSDAGFNDPIRFETEALDQFETKTLFTLQHTTVCSCEERRLNISALHFSSVALCTKPSCKTRTRLSSGF